MKTLSKYLSIIINPNLRHLGKKWDDLEPLIKVKGLSVDKLGSIIQECEHCQLVYTNNCFRETEVEF